MTYLHARAERVRAIVEGNFRKIIDTEGSVQTAPEGDAENICSA
jgi:hypothetical protein